MNSADASDYPQTGHQGTDWQELLVEALAIEVPAKRALPPCEDQASSSGSRQASVLVGVVAEDEPFIWFAQRSRALRHHPGQICFPGGRMERFDKDAAAAALRECREEIGLDSGQVRLLGRLPVYSTITGFVISPFVGWIVPGTNVQPDQCEVERLFPVPLAYAMDAAHYSVQTIRRDGRETHIYAIDFAGDHIWGATAGMLLGLAQRVAIVRGQPFEVVQQISR